MSALRDFDRLRRIPGVRTAGELTRSVLPVTPEIAPVLSHGGLPRKEIVTIQGSPAFSLALALSANATQEHHWCASIGVGTPAVAGLRDFNIDLEHFVNVSVDPTDWLHALSILIDTFAIVITRPLRLTPTQVSRLYAKVREKDMTLLCMGSFPHAGERLTVGQATWDGIDHGAGCLHSCRVRVVNPATGVHTVTLPNAGPVFATLKSTAEVIPFG